MYSNKVLIFKSLVILVCIANNVKGKESSEKPENRHKSLRQHKSGDKTAVGTLANAINTIQHLPNGDTGKRFRNPCKSGNKCGKVMKRLPVPKVAQLENTIMGIMKDLAKMPPGARLPEKYTKTEPVKLLFDQNYKEDPCLDKLEVCLKEDKRRKRVLKKLFFKKYNGLRQDLIGYGGRRLWGGEGNLFYRK